ncbi:hypothetical protein WK13_34635 [Burkholderia ubonensis]|uniref:hypothetical protein n=1 Tax=Burkholderia ubonensis TaxID=101571 RepID=UPI0007597F5F|nr:hypothetical protein [Burkholderia ubonensis]KVR21677.1 hypothetical protein WK13_34635 [Burkholderia ubonensis]
MADTILTYQQATLIRRALDLAWIELDGGTEEGAEFEKLYEQVHALLPKEYDASEFTVMPPMVGPLNAFYCPHCKKGKYGIGKNLKQYLHHVKDCKANQKKAADKVALQSIATRPGFTTFS